MELPLDYGTELVQVIAIRVPRKGDIYVAKTGKLMRCNATNYSRRAKLRKIVYSRGGK